MIALYRVALVALASTMLAALPAKAMANPQTSKPAAKAAKAATAKVNTDTRIYLLRGLLNVFSLGMDALQERLALMGFAAEVDNHNGWLAIANKIAEDRKKGSKGAVVLIGHSLGADVLFQLTERLEKENIPVRLAVFFDPTISHDISGNVEHVLNLYQLNGFGRKVTAPRGYKGELVNMDLSGDASIGHGSIDKSEKLHDLVIAKIMKVAVGPGQRKRPGPPKPKPMGVAPPGSAAALPAATPSPAAVAPSPDTKSPVVVPSTPEKPVAIPTAQVPRI